MACAGIMMMMMTCSPVRSRAVFGVTHPTKTLMMMLMIFVMIILHDDDDNDDDDFCHDYFT